MLSTTNSFVLLLIASTAYSQISNDQETGRICGETFVDANQSVFEKVYKSVAEYFTDTNKKDDNNEMCSRNVVIENTENVKNVKQSESISVEQEKQVDDIIKEAKQFVKSIESDYLNIDPDQIMKAFDDALGIEEDIFETVGENGFEYHPMYRIKPTKVGEINTIELPNGEKRDMKTLAMQPPVFEIEDFISDEECDYIVETAIKTKLARGPEIGDEPHIHRVSKITRLNPPEIDAEFMHRIHEKIAAITKLPVYMIEASEELKVGQYDAGGFYNAHLDTSGNDIKKQHCCFQRACIDEHGEPYEHNDCCSFCRYITFMYYLNDVEGGGETAFPFADLRYSTMVQKQKDFPNWNNLTIHCHSSNLLVKPVKGKAIFWYNRILDNKGYLGAIDWRSHHGGCNVTEGTKWVGLNLISSPIYDHRFTPTRYRNVSASYEKYRRSLQT